MTTLAVLVAELQSEVPAVNSVPTSTQYAQAVKDAVADFSRRCGIGKWAQLVIVRGTAAYALPADFLSMISLASLTGVDGVLISSTGIIPLAADFSEEYSILNKQITFTPTPTYSMTRDYKYKAGWVLTGDTDSETYATMGDDEKQIVMIKAKGMAMQKLANSLASGGGMKYSFGAVSVDKGSGVEGLTSMMYKLHAEFIEACDKYNGAVGSF